MQLTRVHGTNRDDADAEAGFEQCQQIVLRRQFLGDCIGNAIRFQNASQFIRHLASGVDENGLGSEILEFSPCFIRQPVHFGYNKSERLFEQWQGIKTRPGCAERTGDRQFGRSRFQVFGDFAARASVKVQFQPRQRSRQFPQDIGEGRKRYRVRHSDRKRCGFALVN